MDAFDRQVLARTDCWAFEQVARSQRVGRPPIPHADVVVIGLGADDHLDAVASEVQSRGATVSTILADVDFAGGLNLVTRPPATVACSAVLARSTDIALPIPHHGRQLLVAVDPFDPRNPMHAFAHREAAAATQCWADLIQCPRWVNEPWASRRADSKARQLLSASQRGLSVPRTIITADVDSIVGFADACGGSVVHKSMQHPVVRHDDDHAALLHTSAWSVDDLTMLRAGLPHHALFQEQLRARSELRVTVIGSRAVTIRIDRPDGSLPDWRRDLADGALTYSVERLDDATEARLLDTVADLGLVFATVDLIETLDGDVYFLEVNPTGSYLWLERITGLPMTAMLVDELLESR